MRCRIKRINNDSYFNRNITKNVNHWTCKEDAKIFGSVLNARQVIKQYKLKNIEVEKIK